MTELVGLGMLQWASSHPAPTRRFASATDPYLSPPFLNVLVPSRIQSPAPDPSKVELLSVEMPDSSQRRDKRGRIRYTCYTVIDIEVQIHLDFVIPWSRQSTRTSVMKIYLWSIHGHRRFNSQLALLRLAVQQCYLGGRDDRLSNTKLVS